jgi:hypothetical protein
MHAPRSAPDAGGDHFPNFPSATQTGVDFDTSSAIWLAERVSRGRSQTRTVTESAVASLRPRASKMAVSTTPEWPPKRNSSLQEGISQTRAVASSPAVAKRVPSALNRTERTAPTCPSHVEINVDVRRSQIFAVPSPLALARRLPVGSKSRCVIPAPWECSAVAAITSRPLDASRAPRLRTRMPPSSRASYPVAARGQRPSNRPFPLRRPIPSTSTTANGHFVEGR